MSSSSTKGKTRNELSNNTHRRFSTVASYVKELGGDKAHVIEKVLIANNGVGAVKAIRSMRQWAYEVFGDEKAIQFVVMATPEDLRANAEYIRMADIVLDVPGGSNNNNYANVTLIVELGRLHRVNAVWAGWGHASENPVLPDSLAKSNPPIKFIGPAGPPMRALGDKIGSTIIAQTAGVPCISWNGDGILANYDRETGCLPKEAYERGTVSSSLEADSVARKVGFPIMIKASEGGGGKGIRMVENPEEVQNAYRQVSGEVPGSPIFIMKLSSNSRHLEVQLLADEYGEAVALNGRDCSVQRRHQKIIEEGPPIAAPAHIWTKMEKAAVSLAKAVGYTNAGTVEYLYSEPDEKFYFLELNPRLQVEHPVTEMITKVNLPAAQLQVAMGIHLYNIPEIRELYGKNRFEDPSTESTYIDFENTPQVPAHGHCIAVRITAENAEAGFKPTSGGIQEINFRSTPNVWGYFSMDSSGSIHEYADSQFGHLFANGIDREQARRNMALALKEISIRGDISTTVDYISRLIELDDFVANDIDTAWLDKLIKQNVNGIGMAEGLKRGKSLAKINLLGENVCAVIGATIVAFDSSSSDENQFLDALEKGQLPPQTLLSMVRNVELILENIKYKLCCTRNGKNKFLIAVEGVPNKSVEVNIRLLSDGGYLTELDGKCHVAYVTSKGDAHNGMRITIGGMTIVFSPAYDPTSLRTDVAGKLVKKLVEDGSTVKKGEVYCEIEVMKMFMPLKVTESGVLSWCNNEGAALGPGDLLATLVLENPDSVTTSTDFEGDLKVHGWGKLSSGISNNRPHLMLRDYFDLLHDGVSGYALSESNIQRAMDNILVAVIDPSLPKYEIDEQLSFLSGRIDSKLYDDISNIVFNFNLICDEGTYSDTRFPAETICELLSTHTESIYELSERQSFAALTTPLRETAIIYTKCNARECSGSERAMKWFLDILRKWIAVERWFCDGKSYADSVDTLRKANKDNHAHVLEICRTHFQLSSTSTIIVKIIDAIADGNKIHNMMGTNVTNLREGRQKQTIVGGAKSLSDAEPCLSEIGSMGGNSIYNIVGLRARKLLYKQSLPSKEELMSRVSQMIQRLVENNMEIFSEKEISDFINENVSIADIFYPLLNSLTTDKEKLALVELNARRLYCINKLGDFHRDYNERSLRFSFPISSKQKGSLFSNSASVASMNDLSRVASLSGSMHKMDEELSDIASQLSLSSSDMTSRFVVYKLVDKINEIRDKSVFESVLGLFPQFNNSVPRVQGGPANILYIVIINECIKIPGESTDKLSSELEDLLTPFHYQLERADIKRVSFIFHNEKSEKIAESLLPALFTFRAGSNSDFKEDSLFRNIEPSKSNRLELTRLVKNFTLRMLDSHQTATFNIHQYEATPRLKALSMDKAANKNPRIFVRALNFNLEFSLTSFEKMLVDALNSLDFCVHDNELTSDNHLFLNFVSDFDRIVLDPVKAEHIIVTILKRHGERASALGLAEIETKLVCCLTDDAPPIALRMVASNPTGYVHVMNTYIEAVDEFGSTPIFKLVGGTKASLAGSGDSSWQGLKVNSPYPLTRPFDAQRKAALRATDSLYCYDLPALFEAAVDRKWNDISLKGGIEGGILAAKRPTMLMYTKELVVQRKDGISSSWTMQDYSNNDLTLAQIQRGAGANDVGMVAWLMTLNTIEYPNGRQFVLIANDITHKAGSFGTREDVVFKLASDFARLNRIPRLYVAANSGARIGLAESVKKAFKVAFKDPSKPENGFNFLYVTKEDYEMLCKDVKQILVEPAMYANKNVYKVTDIIGIEPDLGVENLKGSGLIAGETSIAYNEIFTMTIVLGRTVGIGAYLVRLGQRTIQKVTSSPIILTGYQALNKLMGVNVYSTNDQLGGPGIMYSNGVSHLIEPDHLRAITSAIDWLAFIPSVRGGILPIIDISGTDVIERSIGFTPSSGIPYDPRCLLTGKEDDDGMWLSGFFDKESFVETLSGWAKTVIVGRARLGGIPMGVIVTENRTIEAVKPADPADLKASETVTQEAGCVWFPNSAYKTAQAINDFRTEDLPLIIFANWRGFSGGQKDMFEEVLKFGALIVDALVAYQEPVFVFIPPFSEIRGGAWVVVDASINASVMEMYAASSARGGVLEANGAAVVKYKKPDLLKTMHRLDEKLKVLDGKMHENPNDEESSKLKLSILDRENALLPVYGQISVQFCELHDTPGRMNAVGVIEKEIEWSEARSFFFWRLRRKLAEFDLRKKIVQTGEVGRGVAAMTALEASSLIKEWFTETPGMTNEMWDNDKIMLNWMAGRHVELEQNLLNLTKQHCAQEVYQVMTAGGQTAEVGTSGIVEGVSKAYHSMQPKEKEQLKAMLKDAIGF